MPINAHPNFLKAEQEYIQAETKEQKLIALKKMISHVPKHKGAENLRKQLKRRLAKLKYTNEKQAKAGKSKRERIKKSEMQALLVGPPNTGKSSIFNILTNQKTKTAPTPFTTYEPKSGTTNFQDVKIQLIDMPPFPNHDQDIINSTDTLLIVIDNLNQLRLGKEGIKNNLSKEVLPNLHVKSRWEGFVKPLYEKNNTISKKENIKKHLENSKAKKIFIFNKADLLNEKEKRKIQATLKSKKLNFILFSAVNPQNLKELKQKIFNSFPIIRVYTKEPHKPATKNPLILKQKSTVADVAEKILKGLANKIKKAKIWGPSSKFAGQPVGLGHTLKDKDTIELQIR